MQRARIFSILTILVMGAATLAPFTAAHAEKIAIVDFRRLLSESPQYKALQAALEQEFDPRKRELLQMQSDLKAKAAKYQRDAAIMSDAEKNKAQDEIQDGEREFGRKQKQLEEDAERKHNKELQRIQRILFQEIESFAKAQNLDAVLAKEATLYTKDASDVTSQIIAAVQLKSSKAPATPAAGAPAAKP